MVYYEPGSYKGTVSLNSDNKGKCKVIIPNDARDRDFHVILVLTDSEWMVYYEPGSYKGTVSLNSDNKGKCKVIIPNDARDRDFHVILVLTDSGEPSLTAYRRFVIDVK